MTTPRTDAEWLDLLQRLNPGGLEPEVTRDQDDVRYHPEEGDAPSAEEQVNAAGSDREEGVEPFHERQAHEDVSVDRDARRDRATLSRPVNRAEQAIDQRSAGRIDWPMDHSDGSMLRRDPPPRP